MLDSCFGNLLLAVRTVQINIHQGSVVQRVVSLSSSLVVKMLPVLVSKISNSQLFLLKKKCE